MNHKTAMKMLDLYSLPASHKFSNKELSFIKRHLSINDYRIRYALWKGHSNKGLYIAFCIDHNPKHWRRDGMEARMEFICERPLTDIEFDETCRNFGTCKRKYKVWYYKHIEQLIKDDLKYNVDTPQEFIDECIKRGYSDPNHVSYVQGSLF